MENKLNVTEDYSRFKYLKKNREVSSAHVSKLVNSIKIKNLMRDLPIIVNQNMEILDGQNRFEALKILKLPVYYKFAIDMSDNDISLINSMSKRWTLEDYLHQYSSNGKDSYIKLSEFMRWSNLSSVNLALKIIKCQKNFTDYKGGIGANGQTADAFKVGNFVYPENDDIQKQYVICLKDLSKFTHRKNPFDRSLVISLDQMQNTKGFDYDRLISKLEQYPLGIYNDANSLIENFERAYNYNVAHNKKLLFKRHMN